MRLDARVVAVAVPILVVAIIVLIGLLNRQSITKEVEVCFVRGCFDTKLAAKHRRIIEKFVHGTKFENTLNLSAAPKTGFLNVYFAASGLSGRLSPIACNCAYLGSSIIICDQRFISSFSSVVNFTPKSFYGENSDVVWREEEKLFGRINEQISEVLLSWLLAHEIGHAVLHESASFERRRAMTELQELEADAFFVEKIFEGADKQQRQKLYFGVTQFIFAVMSTAFQASDGGDKSSGGAAVIAPSADEVHPPWVVRALKLGQRMNKTDPDGSEQNDFYESLSSRFKIRRGATDIGTLCSFENLREVAAQRQQERLKNSGTGKP